MHIHRKLMQSNGIKINLLHAVMIIQSQYLEFKNDNLLISLFILFIKSKIFKSKIFKSNFIN